MAGMHAVLTDHKIIQKSIKIKKQSILNVHLLKLKNFRKIQYNSYRTKRHERVTL